MKLKELRKSLRLSQPQAANLIGIPFRTYCRYEDDPHYSDTFKYKQMVSILSEKATSLVLDIKTIKEVATKALMKNKVETCYLFGSYAKGKATSESDIDLMIISELEGIEYYQLLNELQNAFKKKIDLIRLETAMQNANLMKEIMKDGIKIYG